MLIYPQGLLSGERIAQCSDEAQLHFPRLLALGNGYGRFELSVPRILESAYSGFKVKPSREQLTSWIREYKERHLLFVYQAPNGDVWGQWCGVPKNSLPRYHTAADNRSPEPDLDQICAFEEQYQGVKQKKREELRTHIDLSEDFGNPQKPSEDLRAFPPVVVVGEGVGVEREKRSTRTHEDLQPIATQIALAHPRAQMRKWSATEVPLADRVRIVEAIRAEADRAHCSKTEAGMRILEEVQRISREVPQGEWRYLKDLDDFFRLREYRMSGGQLTGKGGRSAGNQQSQSGPRTSGAERARNVSDDAIDRALAERLGNARGHPDEAGEGVLPQPDTSAGHPGSLSAGMGGVDGGIRPQGVRAVTLDGATGQRLVPDSEGDRGRMSAAGNGTKGGANVAA